MKKSIVLCLILAFPAMVFALTGPCATPPPIFNTWDVYEKFPNPGGSHLPQVDLRVASHAWTIYADGSCLNTNETTCVYTYNLPRASGSGTFYKNELINGAYIVTGTVTLPLVPENNRCAC